MFRGPGSPTWRKALKRPGIKELIAQTPIATYNLLSIKPTEMTLKIVFLTVVALALITLEVASAGECSSQGEDRDWVHHRYTVFELSTTDIVTPSALFFGTAPLQNGT
jgi:hypothetical protein